MTDKNTDDNNYNDHDEKFATKCTGWFFLTGGSGKVITLITFSNSVLVEVHLEL